jgi:arylsulfatase A-like enzyme
LRLEKRMVDKKTANSTSRRNFLRTMSGLLASSQFISKRSWSQIKRPNVIVIFADDLGYGDISGFGYKKSPFKTPNLTRMADEGVKLTQVYVPVPYCAPSRATLLTGRYPFRNGVVSNPTPDAGINNIGLPDSEKTIAESLKTAGYATCCIGKWHLGHTPNFLPRKQGFDEYFGILYSNDMRPVQLVENEKVIEYPVVQATLTKRYTERALSFIEDSYDNNQPFFLYLPHAMPHKPLAASEDFYTPETPNDLYADVIRELDWSVGEIINKLKSLDIDQETLVIFTSDNGPWYGGSTGGLRGMKAKTWDGGLRVPFIARWPGMIPAGIVNSSVVGTIDLFPTILQICGVDLPRDRVIDGEDIWPLLISENEESPHEAIFAMHGPNLAMVRSGKWKLHLRNPGGIPKRGNDWVDPRAPDGVTILAPYEQSKPDEYPGIVGGVNPTEMMLFDVENDSQEQIDLSEQHPEIVQQLKSYADEIYYQMGDFERPMRDEYSKPITGGKLRFWE